MIHSHHLIVNVFVNKPLAKPGGLLKMCNDYEKFLIFVFHARSIKLLLLKSVMNLRVTYSSLRLWLSLTILGQTFDRI